MNEIQKFLSKVEKSRSCWQWTGSKNPQGYGTTRFRGRTEGAHRVAHKLFIGPVPRGINFCVMHSCDVPSCVNPKHLSLGTRSENMKDMFRKKREGNHITAVRRAKTHCPKGHPYSGYNVYMTVNGQGKPSRKCRKCANIRNRVRFRIRKQP